MSTTVAMIQTAWVAVGLAYRTEVTEPDVDAEFTEDFLSTEVGRQVVLAPYRRMYAVA